MTEGFALEYICRRMRELGYEDRYLLRYHNFRLDGKAILRMEAHNQYYYLISPTGEITVESNMGCYDAASDLLDDLQYEHRGTILLTNTSNQSAYLRLLQVIPQFPKTA